MKLGNSLIKCNVERIGGGRKQKNIAHGRRRSSESSAESLYLRGIKKWKESLLKVCLQLLQPRKLNKLFKIYVRL